MLALYALIEPEDHIISMYPTYQQLYDIPKSLGAEVDLWEIEEDKGWLPDLDQLRRLIRPNTKMICINNANNPTSLHLLSSIYMKRELRLTVFQRPIRFLVFESAGWLLILRWQTYYVTTAITQ